MHNKSRRINRTRTGLVVIDIQERLLPAIFEKERVVANTLRLIKGAAVLGVPVLVTEQYPLGIGPTVSEIAADIPGFAPMDKLTFSSCAAPGFLDEVKSRALTDLILCGIEAHVCVCQSCLDLLEGGFAPFVVADAVSSRTPENHRLGLERMREAGALIVSTEMALFELLGRAGTEEFKQVLALVK